MKKILSTMIVVMLLFTLSSCKTHQHTEPTDVPVAYNSQATLEDSLASQLTGAWVSHIGRNNRSFQIVLFYKDGTAFFCDVFEDSSVAKAERYRNTGTYQIKDGKLWLDLYGYYVNSDDGFSVEIDGNKILLETSRNDKPYQIELVRLQLNENEKHTVAGTWRPMNSTEIPFRFGNIDSGTMTELVLYNDGSYRWKCSDGENYGEYEVVFDGEAIQMKQSLNSGRVDIEMLGFGLLLYEYKYYNAGGGEGRSVTYILGQSGD